MPRVPNQTCSCQAGRPPQEVLTVLQQSLQQQLILLHLLHLLLLIPPVPSSIGIRALLCARLRLSVAPLPGAHSLLPCGPFLPIAVIRVSLPAAGVEPRAVCVGAEHRRGPSGVAAPALEPRSLMGRAETRLSLLLVLLQGPTRLALQLRSLGSCSPSLACAPMAQPVLPHPRPGAAPGWGTVRAGLAALTLEPSISALAGVLLLPKLAGPQATLVLASAAQAAVARVVERGQAGSGGSCSPDSRHLWRHQWSG